MDTIFPNTYTWYGPFSLHVKRAENLVFQASLAQRGGDINAHPATPKPILTDLDISSALHA